MLQETFAPILYVLRYRDFDEAIALNNDGAAGPVARRSSPTTCAKPSGSCPRPARTAASPTSTSARRAPRSAARSAARRKPAAGARAARTAGAPTCGARPTPSITGQTCRSLKASASTSLHSASLLARRVSRRPARGGTRCFQGLELVGLERRRDQIALGDVAAELAHAAQLLDASRPPRRWRSGRGRGRAR